LRAVVVFRLPSLSYLFWVPGYVGPNPSGRCFNTLRDDYDYDYDVPVFIIESIISQDDKIITIIKIKDIIIIITMTHILYHGRFA
jgi:hypothetical protein